MASLVTMRHFIELSLYGPNGYFRKARPLIIDAPHALTSNSARQLNSAIGKLYRDSPQAEFATASSLFRESYAEAVGACRKAAAGRLWPPKTNPNEELDLFFLLCAIEHTNMAEISTSVK